MINSHFSGFEMVFLRNPIIYGVFLAAFIWFALSGYALGHVIPEDQLRNQVYLTKTQALKTVFNGAKKISHGKRKLTQGQRQTISQILDHRLKMNQVDFYTSQVQSGQKITAIMDHAAINSHPPTLAKLMIVFDSAGLISNIKILEYKGPQRAEILSDSFLGQFLGKSAQSDFSIITSNEGITQTVMALRDTIQRSTVIFDVVLKGN